MENNLDTFLNKNLQKAVNDNQFINLVETQIKEPFENSENILQRMKLYFEFLDSEIVAENNEETNITNRE